MWRTQAIGSSIIPQQSETPQAYTCGVSLELIGEDLAPYRMPSGKSWIDQRLYLLGGVCVLLIMG